MEELMRQEIEKLEKEITKTLAKIKSEASKEDPDLNSIIKLAAKKDQLQFAINEFYLIIGRNMEGSTK